MTAGTCARFSQKLKRGKTTIHHAVAKEKDRGRNANVWFRAGHVCRREEEDVCTTRWDESPFFAEDQPFLVRISLILVSGRGLMNSLHPVPEILALITEAEGRKGEKAKQQPSNRETETERVCQLVRLRSLSEEEEEEKRTREKRGSRLLSEPRKSATNDDPFFPLSLSFVSLLAFYCHSAMALARSLDAESFTSPNDGRGRVLMPLAHPLLHQ